MKAPKLTLSHGDALLLGQACLQWRALLGNRQASRESEAVDAAIVEVMTQLDHLQTQLYAYALNYPAYQTEEGGDTVDRSDIPF